MTAYATTQDVRDFGVSVDDASNTRVNRALARATTTIDRFVGNDRFGFTFGAQSTTTITLDGIYNGTIPLPRPFSAVSAVTVDLVPLTVDQYELRDWGIQLYGTRIRDADGFPLYWQALKLYPRIAAVVRVTATFGTTTIDPTIVEACAMLAAQYSRLKADDQMPSHFSMMMVGGQRVMQSAPDGLTTGNIEVDEMLAPFVFASGLVH